MKKLSGSGTVRLAADLTAEDGQQAGTFTVGSAAENSSLTVRLTNEDMSKELTADDVTSEQAKDLLGNVAAKDVETTMKVDEGMYNGAFDVMDDGSTITRGPNSVMQSTLELATVAPLALNRILTNDVHKRMGDIRSMKQTSGAWARYDGGKLSGESGLENDFHTIQVGVDTVPAPMLPALVLLSPTRRAMPTTSAAKPIWTSTALLPTACGWVRAASSLTSWRGSAQPRPT